jgi:hypothetical protein
MALNRRKALHLAAGFGTALALAGPLEVGATGDADGVNAARDTLVIDDFASAPDATIGGRWSYTSDRVMGGVSNGGGAYEMVDERVAIRLYGDVSTAQNGGFIQVSLRIDGRRIDAEQYSGIEVDVLGNGEDYNIHVTTTRSFPPWRFYKHTFATTDTWTRIRLPWSDFTSESFRQPLDPSTINRLNVSAYARDFEADLAVSRIALYR